jgi:hypothetical protein
MAADTASTLGRNWILTESHSLEVKEMDCLSSAGYTSDVYYVSVWISSSVVPYQRPEEYGDLASMLTLRTDEDFFDFCHPTRFPAMRSDVI